MKSNQKGNHHQSTNTPHKSHNRCTKVGRSSRAAHIWEALDNFETDPVWSMRLKAELLASIRIRQKISIAVVKSDYATFFEMLGLLASLIQNPQSPFYCEKTTQPRHRVLFCDNTAEAIRYQILKASKKAPVFSLQQYRCTICQYLSLFNDSERCFRLVNKIKAERRNLKKEV